jgi:hypothetical protein
MKNKIEDNLITILKQDFPDQHLHIDRMWDQGQNFRELAQDYIQCKRKICYLEKTGKLDIMNQYMLLLKELENEIIKFLENQKTITS